MVECRNIADPCGYLLKNANNETNICAYFCTHTSFYHPIRKITDEFIMYTLFLELSIRRCFHWMLYFAKRKHTLHDNFEMKRPAAINRQWTTIINHSWLRYNLAYFDITLWSVSFVLITTTKKYEQKNMRKQAASYPLLSNKFLILGFNCHRTLWITYTVIVIFIFHSISKIKKMIKQKFYK